MFCTGQAPGNTGYEIMNSKNQPPQDAPASSETEAYEYTGIVKKIHNMKLNIPLRAWWVRGCAIVGLFGLIGLITIWNGWLAPVQQVPLWLELLLFILPLALLIRGILRGFPMTHVYATMVSLLYMIFGCWYMLTPQEEIYGYLMLGLSVVLYIGGFFGAKLLTTQPDTDKST